MRENENTHALQKGQKQNVIGPQVRRIRMQRNLSQREICVRLYLKGYNYRRESIAEIEGQTRCVRDRELPILALVLGVSVSDLFPQPNAPRPNAQPFSAYARLSTKSQAPAGKFGPQN